MVRSVFWSIVWPFTERSKTYRAQRCDSGKRNARVFRGDRERVAATQRGSNADPT